MIRRILVLILLLTPFFALVNGQDTISREQIVEEKVTENVKEGDVEEEAVVEQSSRCLTVNELINLVHMPFRDVYEMLDDKGYQMGFFFENTGVSHYDTINEVLLTYSRVAFNYKSDKNSVIWIYRSNDSLCNIVEVEQGDLECALYSEFHDNGFSFDRENNVFHGTYLYNDEINGYFVNYLEDEARQTLKLTIRDTSDIMNYVRRIKTARRQHVYDLIAKAVDTAAHNHYLPAMHILDSLNKIGVLDAAVLGTRNMIAEQAEKYYYARLDDVVNKRLRLDSGIYICDTLMMFCTMQDSVAQIRSILVAQDSGSTSLYSYLCPNEFEKIVGQLERLINEEISLYSTQDRYRLKFDFTFHTDSYNASSGTIVLQKGQGIMPRTTDLQNRVDEIAQSPLIQPRRSHGIYVIIHQTLSADVNWSYRTQKVVDNCDSKNILLIPFVEYVDNKYFITCDTVRTSLAQESDEPIIRRYVHKPTKRIYEFGIKEKECHGKKYTDVELVSFHTSGALAWMPSLVVPGLGTKIMGLCESAAGRYVPFYIFGAIAVGGLALEKHLGPENRPTIADGDAEHVWQYKNFGYYMGGFGAVIAGAIYISDLYEGISTTFSNFSRSRALRKELRKRHVRIQREDIRL